MDINNGKLEDDKIDIKEFLLKMSEYWYVFLICLAIALLIAYALNRTSVPVYEVRTSVLIQEEQSMLDSRFANDLGMYNDQHQLSNEIGILKSYNLTERAIKQLDFEIEYYYFDGFIQHEIYKDCPFKIIIDSSKIQPLYSSIEIEITSPDEFKLSANNKNVTLYDVREYKPLKFKTKYSFSYHGKLFYPIKNENIGFTVVPRTPGDLSKYVGKKYYFIFLDEKTVISKYRNTNISDNKGSSILSLSIQGTNVQKLTEFLNTLTNEYLKKGLEKKNLIAENTIRFIDSQIIDVSDSLHSSESRLEEFKANNSLMNVDFQTQQVFTSFENLRNQKAEMLVKRKYFDYLKNYLNDNNKKGSHELIAPSSIGIQDVNFNKLISDLTNLLNDKSELSLNSKKENPYLTSIDLRIKYMKQSILDNLENLTNGTDIAIQDIDRRIDEISEQLNKLPERQRKLVNYERKFKLNDALYTYLLTKRSEVQISKASYLPNNEIIDKARENEFSIVGPNTRKNYMIALLLGLGLPACLILLRNYFNDKILLNEDIEKLSNFAILGHILRTKEKSPTVVNDYPNSLCSESIRAIRTSFQFLANENQKHIILVTSSMMSEGKSFTCTNLALSFSLNNKKVLIMNFDLRKPTIHKYLGIESDKGLSSYLSGYVSIEDIILKTKFDYIDAILSGPVPPNPMELIASENTKILFQFLHEKYDYIIIDTPPVGMVADALLLIKFTDVNIFVVRHNFTMKKVLSQVNQNLLKKGIHNFNIILNDVQIGKKYLSYSHGYAYQYGYGYGYGYYNGEKKRKSS